MKQFSPVLNIILLVAVGVLYFLHFTGNKKPSVVAKTSPLVASASGAVQAAVVAYVDMDSLNNSVPYIKEKKKELEAEQRQIQAEYEAAYRQLEADKNEFLKKGNAITQQEAEEFQGKLMQRQQQVEAKKQSMGQNLASKGSTIMEDIQRKLKEFFSEYNKDKKFAYIFATGTGLDYILYKDDALDITDDIVKGLNEKMNKKRKE